MTNLSQIFVFYNGFEKFISWICVPIAFCTQQTWH